MTISLLFGKWLTSENCFLTHRWHLISRQIKRQPSCSWVQHNFLNHGLIGLRSSALGYVLGIWDGFLRHSPCSTLCGVYRGWSDLVLLFRSRGVSLKSIIRFPTLTDSRIGNSWAGKSVWLFSWWAFYSLLSLSPSLCPPTIGKTDVISEERVNEVVRNIIWNFRFEIITVREKLNWRIIFETGLQTCFFLISKKEVWCEKGSWILIRHTEEMVKRRETYLVLITT